MYPGNREALEKLGSYRLMILSNGSPAMLEAVVAANGLDEVFERLISVDELGVFKPDPRVYQLVCRSGALGAEEIAFVSSNYFDIAGASSCGLSTYWINRNGGQPDGLGLRAGRELDNLGELAEILDGNG